ncbi:hypothetical protein Z043_114800 [Scleropages formosus]|uniref:Uncharacterized protein n=1 Tax=Scleropages formosus TaxID=113540 RepID=A0A0P7WSL6_SCLFO|nr:hypothetical protein Z043_114800 [Scleropages formosus]
MAAKRCQSTKRQHSLSKPKLEESVPSPSELSQVYRRHHLKSKRRKLQRLRLNQLGERSAAAAGGRQQTSGCLREPLPLLSTLTASSVFSLQQQTRLLEEGVHRRKGRTRKPSKYTCRFCSRTCAKCCVLQKRICSHTGERLYPFSPCDSYFKSKSNLYKHPKSHIHRSKLGISNTTAHPSRVKGRQRVEKQKDFMEANSLGSEYKSKHLGFLPSALEEPAGRALQKSSSIPPPRATDAQGSMDSQRMEGAHAVKQRLVMRLSERKRTPVDSSDEGTACVDPWSKGSTESGYFSRSESSELPQTSPPNSEAKSYAEIILGKFGRVDQGPRNTHQQCHRCSEPERRRIPLNVPATQVIEHITKLITINEALVDTREIDSVKPRRSLSRKNSLEVPRVLKAPSAYHPKGDTSGSSSTCSVDVKCLRNNLHPKFLSVDSLPRRPSPVPLLRSRSMPSSASAGQPPTPRFRSSHSFDERQATPAGKRVGHHHGILRRQRALEAPFEPDMVLQEMAPYYSSAATVLCGPCQPTTRDSCPREPESCIPCFRSMNGPEAHMLSSKELLVEGAKRKASNEYYYSRVLPDILCEKQKEDGKEMEERLSNARLVLSSFSPTSSFQMESNATSEKLSSKANVMLLRSDGRNIRKGISVIQHTSAFERSGNVVTALTSEGGHQPPPTELPQPLPNYHLMRQHSIQVPEVLLAEDPDFNIGSGTSLETLAVTHAKESEKFRYPQRSATLAQFPAEKLPPKKKRLCLTESQTSVVPGTQRGSFSYRCLPPQGNSVAYNEGHIFPLVKQATFGACDKKVYPSSTGEIILPAKSNVNPISPREPTQPTPSAELSQNELSLRLSPVSPPPEALAELRTGSTLSVGSMQRVLSVSQCPTSSLVSLTTRSVVPLRHRVLPFQPVQDLSESGAAFCSPDPTSLQPVAEVQRQDTKSSPLPSLSLMPILCFDQHTCSADVPRLELSAHMNPTTVPVRIQNAFPVCGKGLYTSQSLSVVQKNRDSLQIKLEEQSHLNPCVEPRISDVSDNLSWTQPLKPSTPLECEVTGSRSKKRALSQAGSLELFPDKEPQLKRIKNEDEGNDGCVGERPVVHGESNQDKVVKEPTLICERKMEEKTQKVKFNEHKKESEFRESESSKEKDNKINDLRKMDTSRTNETNSCINTATMVSWCYLKYLNPSCSRALQNSGCSSWCANLPSPNLPGFSTRVALSLLCSKQKRGPELYTVASMIQPAAEQLVPATKTQRSEVDMHPVRVGMTQVIAFMFSTYAHI